MGNRVLRIDQEGVYLVYKCIILEYFSKKKIKGFDKKPCFGYIRNKYF